MTAEKQWLNKKLGAGGPVLDTDFLGGRALQLQSMIKLAQRWDREDPIARELWAEFLGLLPLSLIAPLLWGMDPARRDDYLQWAADRRQSMLHAKLHALIAAAAEWSHSFDARIHAAVVPAEE